MAPATQSCDFDSHQRKRDAIPTIDLSGFKDGEKLNEECLKSLVEACEIGSFRVVNHGITDDVFQNADKVCREVFELSSYIKKRNVSNVPYGGYLGPVPVRPYFESQGIVDVPNPQNIKEFSDLMWPEGNQNFCEILDEYTTKMEELSRRIHEILLNSWGVGKYYSSDFGHFNILRMNMYLTFPSDVDSDSLGLYAHRDMNSLTLVHEDVAAGLQVMNDAGNWENVENVPNSIIVFAGHSFQAWSNGRIRSSKHRVMVNGKQSRLALCFFSSYLEEEEIRTPGELVSEENPLRYRAFTYGDFVKFKQSEEGGKFENTLEAYAAIGKC